MAPQPGCGGASPGGRGPPRARRRALGLQPGGQSDLTPPGGLRRVGTDTPSPQVGRASGRGLQSAVGAGASSAAPHARLVGVVMGGRAWRDAADNAKQRPAGAGCARAVRVAMQLQAGGRLRAPGQHTGVRGAIDLDQAKMRVCPGQGRGFSRCRVAAAALAQRATPPAAADARLCTGRAIAALCAVPPAPCALPGSSSTKAHGWPPRWRSCAGVDHHLPRLAAPRWRRWALPTCLGCSRASGAP